MSSNQKSGLAPRLDENMASVNPANRAVAGRRLLARRAEAGLGMDGVIGLGRRMGLGSASLTAREAGRYLLGGHKNEVLEAAGVLDEGRAEGSDRKQARSMVYAHTLKDGLAADLQARLDGAVDALREYPRLLASSSPYEAAGQVIANVQRAIGGTDGARLTELRQEHREVLAKLATASRGTEEATALYRERVRIEKSIRGVENSARYTMASVLAEMGVANAVKGKVHQVAGEISREQIEAATLLSVQRDALIVVASPKSDAAKDHPGAKVLQVPQVIGFTYVTGNGERRITGIDTKHGGEVAVVAKGVFVRDPETGALAAAETVNEYSFKDFLAKVGLGDFKLPDDPRYIPYELVEALREKGVEPITAPAKEGNLYPEGVTAKNFTANLLIDGLKTVSVKDHREAIESVVEAGVKAVLAELEVNAKNHAKQGVKRQYPGMDADDPEGFEALVNSKAKKILEQYAPKSRALFEAKTGVASVRALGAFQDYVAARQATIGSMRKNPYKHDLPIRLSRFLVSKAGYQKGEKVPSGREGVADTYNRPDKRFTEIDRVLNDAKGSRERFVRVLSTLDGALRGERSRFSKGKPVDLQSAITAAWTRLQLRQDPRCVGLMAALEPFREQLPDAAGKEALRQHIKNAVDAIQQTGADRVEDEALYSSDAIREIREMLQDKKYGGLAFSAIEDVVGEDAVAEYAGLYIGAVSGMKKAWDGYRKASREALADGFLDIMLTRKQAIPGVIESDPIAGIGDREDWIGVIRNRMLVAMGAAEPMKVQKEFEFGIDKVDAEIRRFLATDPTGRFVSPELVTALYAPEELEGRTDAMARAMRNCRETALLVDSLEEPLNALHWDFNSVNRILRNGCPRTSAEDQMKANSGQTVVSVPTNMNPSRPFDLVARDGGGKWTVYPMRWTLFGQYAFGEPEPLSDETAIPEYIDKANMNDTRVEILAWAVTPGRESVLNKILSGVNGLSLDTKGEKKLFRVEVQPGRLFEALGLHPSATMMPKMRMKAPDYEVFAYSKEYIDKDGTLVKAASDRACLPMPTSSVEEPMVYFPWPTDKAEVPDCLSALDKWLDNRAVATLDDAALQSEFGRWKPKMLEMVGRSMKNYVGVGSQPPSRDFVSYLPAFGANGSRPTGTILGTVCVQSAEWERERPFGFKPSIVAGAAQALDLMGRGGMVVNSLVITSAAEEQGEA